MNAARLRLRPQQQQRRRRWWQKENQAQSGNLKSQLVVCSSSVRKRRKDDVGCSSRATTTVLTVQTQMFGFVFFASAVVETKTLSSRIFADLNLRGDERSAVVLAEKIKIFFLRSKRNAAVPKKKSRKSLWKTSR